MRWWWTPSSPSKLSDKEIVARVDSMVATGRIKPELAQHFERALRAAADGAATDMVDILRRVPPAKFPRPRG